MGEDEDEDVMNDKGLFGYKSPFPFPLYWVVGNRIVVTFSAPLIIGFVAWKKVYPLGHNRVLIPLILHDESVNRSSISSVLVYFPCSLLVKKISLVDLSHFLDLRLPTGHLQ